MNSVTILALVGFLASTAYGLKCKTCVHQTFDGDYTDANAKAMSEEIGMWNEDCLKASEAAGTECATSEEAKAAYCYTVAAETDEFAYKSNLTGTEDDVKSKVQLYRRGCAILSNDTEADTITGKTELKKYQGDFTKDLPVKKTGTYKDFEGKLMLCTEDDCNKNKIDEVSGSAALVASVSLVVGIFAVWIVGSQA